MEDRRSLVSWGGWCGIVFVGIYLGVILLEQFGSAPAAATTRDYLAALGSPSARRQMMLLHFLVAAWGLVGMVWAVGLSRLLTADRPRTSATIAQYFALAGFAIVACMLIVQGAVMAHGGRLFNLAVTEAEQNSLVTAYRHLRIIDQGLDLAWDVYISSAGILFSVAMLSQKQFGKVFGLSGVLIMVVLLAINIWQAPVPPTPDVGPLAGLWVLAVSVQMLRAVKTLAH